MPKYVGSRTCMFSKYYSSVILYVEFYVSSRIDQQMSILPSQGRRFYYRNSQRKLLVRQFPQRIRFVLCDPGSHVSEERFLRIFVGVLKIPVLTCQEKTSKFYHELNVHPISGVYLYYKLFIFAYILIQKIQILLVLIAFDNLLS